MIVKSFNNRYLYKKIKVNSYYLTGIPNQLRQKSDITKTTDEDQRHVS